MLPARCQRRLDKLDEICLARIAGAAEIERGDCLAGSAEASVSGSAVQYWEVVLAVAIATVAAGGIGLGAGILIGGTR